MKRLNLLLTLSSANLLLITAERFSPTTKVLLQPNSYLRLHELVQMSILILISVLIPCFIFYTVSGNFEALKRKNGKLLLLLFVVGAYFYATGNGVHEMSSFFFNMYCPQDGFASASCKSMFFDDYYFGNVVYFIGAFLMTIAPILVETKYPTATYTRRDYIVLAANSLVYSLAIIAYAAFDRVAVGLFYTVITTLFVIAILILSKNSYTRIPLTIYTALSYTIGTLIGVVIRLGMSST